MKRVVYRSTSNLGLNDVGILDVIRACDRNNEKAGITGVLWFNGRFFLHAIEGERQVVGDLFSKLRRDLRHCSIYVIGERRIEKRDFTDFQVRFHRNVVSFDSRAHRFDSRAHRIVCPNTEPLEHYPSIPAHILQR